MPRLKVTDEELNIQELEEAEYQEGDFERYDGEDPPKGTVLNGVVKKMWWTYTSADDPMVKVLFVAEGNTGDEEQYEGCPVWDNLALIPSAKFRWQPFLDNFGLTITEVKKNTYVSEDYDENMDASPITKIAKFAPGSDDAYCRIVTGRHRYNDNWQVDVSKWMEWEEPEEPEEEEPEEEETPPAKGRGASSRGKTSPDGQKTPARSRRRAEPEPEEEEEADVEEEEEETPSPKTRRSATGRTGTAATRATKSAPTRGRGRSRKPADEEADPPPF